MDSNIAQELLRRQQYLRGGNASFARASNYNHDIPPHGCNPDAIKLFVGNIPKSYTADSLRPLFEAIGAVIELVVVRDKCTDESKGSAFVWYQTRPEAERAIAELHLRRVLQDPTGEQDRPLVVRRANPKIPTVHAATAFQQSQFLGDSDLPAHLQGGFMQSLTGRHSHDSGVPQFTTDHLKTMQAMQDQYGSMGLTSGLSQPESDLLRGFAGRSQNLGALMDLNQQSLLGTSAAPSVFQTMSSMPPQTTMTNTRPNDVSNILQSALNSALGQMTLALPIPRSHVAFVATSLHTIQGNTGASVQLTPGPGDSYVLLLSGNDSQVDAAKSLVHELVAQNA